MSRRNKQPKVTQQRGLRSWLGRAGNATAHNDQPKQPGRWRRANIYQKVDLVLATTATIAATAYALTYLGHHIAFLGAVSAVLSPWTTVILGTVLLSACLLALSAAIQLWKTSDKMAEENMDDYKQMAGDIVEDEPTAAARNVGGAEFNPHPAAGSA